MGPTGLSERESVVRKPCGRDLSWETQQIPAVANLIWSGFTKGLSERLRAPRIYLDHIRCLQYWYHKSIWFVADEHKRIPATGWPFLNFLGHSCFYVFCTCDLQAVKFMLCNMHQHERRHVTDPIFGWYSETPQPIPSKSGTACFQGAGKPLALSIRCPGFMTRVIGVGWNQQVSQRSIRSSNMVLQHVIPIPDAPCIEYWPTFTIIYPNKWPSFFGQSSSTFIYIYMENGWQRCAMLSCIYPLKWPSFVG